MIKKGGIYNNGAFGALGGEGNFWSELGHNEIKKAWFYKFTDTSSKSFYGTMNYGMSCRCVRENKR